MNSSPVAKGSLVTERDELVHEHCISTLTGSNCRIVLLDFELHLHEQVVISLDVGADSVEHLNLLHDTSIVTLVVKLSNELEVDGWFFHGLEGSSVVSDRHVHQLGLEAHLFVKGLVLVLD